MTKERELLRKALLNFDATHKFQRELKEEIRAYLADEEVKQEEEPIGYLEFIDDAGLNFCSLEPTGEYPYQKVYLHPSPQAEQRKPLSNEEIKASFTKGPIIPLLGALLKEEE